MHAECQGKYAPLSEGYTPALARKVHKALLKSCVSLTDRWVASCVVSSSLGDEAADAAKDGVG